MAIVQTEAQVVAIGRLVGIPDERGKDIKAAGAGATTLQGLRLAVNSIGYYSEKADQLVAAGITMA